MRILEYKVVINQCKNVRLSTSLYAFIKLEITCE